ACAVRFLCPSARTPPAIPSSPTRRSSDLKQLTVDKARLRKTFSQSSADSHLTIEARASRSQRFSFRLPEKAEISSVMLNGERVPDRKSTRLNSSHVKISYAVFCLKIEKEQ